MKKQEVKELIDARYDSAKKYLSGKDLEVYKTYLHCEPYFMKQGSFKRYLPSPSNNPKEHRNWKHFDRLHSLMETLQSANLDDYLEAVFTKSYDDQISKRLVYPSMLVSEWAVNKYASWVKSPFKTKVEKSPTDFKGEVILATKRYIDNFCTTKGITQKEFFSYTSSGSIFPDSIMLIYSGVVSKLCCAGLRSFWKMLEGLDDDVRQEFIDVEELQRLRQGLRMDPKVKEYLKAAFGDDVV